jgi:hypothetical protein
MLIENAGGIVGKDFMNGLVGGDVEEVSHPGGFLVGNGPGTGENEDGVGLRV